MGVGDMLIMPSALGPRLGNPIVKLSMREGCLYVDLALTIQDNDQLHILVKANCRFASTFMFTRKGKLLR